MPILKSDEEIHAEFKSDFIKNFPDLINATSEIVINNQLKFMVR